MNRIEIRITGYGGQGVVLSGYIIGRATAVHASKHATMIQSFGPEARGSACSCTLVLSDDEILYPYIHRPDIFVVMSSEGYGKYGGELKDDGVLIYERDLVHPSFKPGQRAYGISSTRIAESLGRTLVQNIVMVGFFAAAAGVVSKEQLEQAVKASVPSGTEELNLKAFEAGWRFFQEEYAGKEKRERAVASAPGA